MAYDNCLLFLCINEWAIDRCTTLLSEMHQTSKTHLTLQAELRNFSLPLDYTDVATKNFSTLCTVKMFILSYYYFFEYEQDVKKDNIGVDIVLFIVIYFCILPRITQFLCVCMCVYVHLCVFAFIFYNFIYIFLQLD